MIDFEWIELFDPRMYGMVPVLVLVLVLVVLDYDEHGKIQNRWCSMMCRRSFFVLPIPLLEYVVRYVRGYLLLYWPIGLFLYHEISYLQMFE